MKCFAFIVVMVSMIQLKISEASNCDDCSTQKSISVLRIITRDEWLAQSAKNELPNLSLPVKRVIIADTRTGSCETQVSL